MDNKLALFEEKEIITKNDLTDESKYRKSKKQNE